MDKDEQITRARRGEIIGDGRDQMNVLVTELNRARGGNARIHDWYSARWKRLHELIKSDACHIEEEACNIMANGTRNSMEPPEYETILGDLRRQLADAERELRQS